MATIASQQTVEERVAARRAALMAAGKAAGFAHIVITYSGSGDEGAYDSFYGVLPGGDIEDEGVPLTGVPIGDVGDGLRYRDLEELAEFVADDIVHCVHPGYELDEGGSGTVNVQIATGKIHVTMLDRFVGETMSETEL